MLILNRAQVKELANPKEMVEIIENAMKLYETGQFVMPDRISVAYQNETYLYMPAFTESLKGTKVLTLYPDNLKRKKPTIYGLMLLNHHETGKIEAVIDGAALTALRTASVGACGIQHTTPESISTLGVIGAGVQGYYQAIFATQYRPIKSIYVFDVSNERGLAFVGRLKQELPRDIDVRLAKTSEDLLEHAELIITTTTSNTPVLPDNQALLKGKHFIGIGSYKPSMQEFPKALFDLLDKMYIDVRFAKEESGDVLNPLKNAWIQDADIHTLGELILGKTVLERNTTSLYKSVGMALFDVEIAAYFVNKAKKMGIGYEVPM